MSCDRFDFLFSFSCIINFLLALLMIRLLFVLVTDDEFFVVFLIFTISTSAFPSFVRMRCDRIDFLFLFSRIINFFLSVR